MPPPEAPKYTLKLDGLSEERRREYMRAVETYGRLLTIKRRIKRDLRIIEEEMERLLFPETMPEL
jgi:hypothetical protein